MRIAIDIHGTIDFNPGFWGKIIEFLQILEIPVFILSGPEQSKILARLQSLGVDATNLTILSVADYIKSSKKKYWYDEYGDFWTDENTWNEAKALICATNMIDVWIDDCIEYYRPDIHRYTRFILYKEGEFKEPGNEGTKSNNMCART